MLVPTTKGSPDIEDEEVEVHMDDLMKMDFEGEGQEGLEVYMAESVIHMTDIYDKEAVQQLEELVGEMSLQVKGLEVTGMVAPVVDPAVQCMKTTTQEGLDIPEVRMGGGAAHHKGGTGLRRWPHQWGSHQCSIRGPGDHPLSLGVLSWLFLALGGVTLRSAASLCRLWRASRHRGQVQLDSA